MRGLHAGIIVVGGAAMALLTLGTVDCAAPTQIIVEVYSDACPAPGKPPGQQSINTTGIAVGKVDGIDSKPPSALKDSCDNPPGVGTLTIYPSGANDEEVAIKVVSGVDTTPDRCAPPDYAGCIVNRRVMRFVPNTTQHAIVRLLLACLNRICGAGKTCDNGVCKAQTDVLPDGTTRPDAGVEEASVTADATPANDGAPVDPCAGCAGTCANGTCTVDCTKQDCATGNLCAPGLPCAITCGRNHCSDVTCTTSAKCTLLCDGMNACGKVTCDAADCDVTCNGARSCQDPAGITLHGTTSAKLLCKMDMACSGASCTSPDCELTCSPSRSSCPPDLTQCFGGCSLWTPPTIVR